MYHQAGNWLYQCKNIILCSSSRQRLFFSEDYRCKAKIYTFVPSIFAGRNGILFDRQIWWVVVGGGGVILRWRSLITMLLRYHFPHIPKTCKSIILHICYHWHQGKLLRKLSVNFKLLWSNQLVLPVMVFHKVCPLKSNLQTRLLVDCQGINGFRQTAFISIFLWTGTFIVTCH